MSKKSCISNSKFPRKEQLKMLVLPLVFSIALILGIFSLESAFGDTDPHNIYTTATNFCKSCHTSHGAVDPTIIMNSETVKELCYLCHGILGGSNTDVQTGTSNALSDFGEATIGVPSKTSFHPVKPLTDWSPKGIGDISLQCTDCHTTCVNSSNQAKLLRAGPNEITSGNEFCLVCHGSPSNPNSNETKAGYNMGGDHETNYNSAAHSIFVPWASTGTNIQCENCHTQHGSNSNYLIDYRLTKLYPNEQLLCYQCHSSVTSNTWNNRYIEGEFLKESKHDLTSGNGAKVECESCHNSHFVKQVSTNDYWQPDRSSNPLNTIQLMSQVDSSSETWDTTFCLSCHSSSPPAMGFSATSAVPYTITFPNMSTFNFFSGWNKSTNDIGVNYGFTDSGHYALDPNINKRVGCGNCHDPHASENKSLTAFSGAITQTDMTSNHETVYNVFRNNTSNYKEEKLCLTCHSSPSGTNCTQSGCHSVNMKNISSVGGDEIGTLYLAVGGTTTVYKWSASSPNTWTEMTAALDQFGEGSALAWGNSNLIYAQMGGGTTKYNVYKITDNSWASTSELGAKMSDSPENNNSGSSMIWDNKSQIYSLAGNNTSNMHRYSLSSDKWDNIWAGNSNTSTPAAAPAEITNGGAMVFARDPNYTDSTSSPSNSDEFIYAFKGGLNTFWKYQIVTDLWNPGASGGDPADLPDGINTGDGASLAWTRDNYIYALRGANTNDFWRYSVSANSWQQMPSLTVGVNNYSIGAGGSLTWDGDKYLYVIQGGGNNAFLRYDIINQQWDKLTDIPVNVTIGSSSVFLRKTVHPYKNYENRHSDTEAGGQVSFGTSNRHSECGDCHDSHAAKAGTNDTKSSGAGYGSASGNTISNVLLGSFGAMPLYNGVGLPVSYQVSRLTSTASDYQYELCFKCHSDYSGYQSSQTNTALEFNPANASQHGVIQTGTNTYINQSTMEEPFSSTYSSGGRATVACSDCHQSSNSNDAKGSHGSEKPNILKANSDLDLCLICHKSSVYNASTTPQPNPSRYDHSIRAWNSATDPGAHLRGRYCRNCHAGRLGDLHGTNTIQRFMTGTHIINWISGSCATDGNCHPTESPSKTY